MIKRVNSTGRKRITRSHADVEVHDGDPRTFDAHIHLEDFDAPPDAEVVLEATCAGSSVIQRFHWGTTANLTQPIDRRLHSLHGKNVFFSLKVIDRSERFGRLLGLAERIRPLKGGDKTQAGRKGILPVETVDLGDELWRLEYRTEDVFLLVNERISGLADRIRFDPAVFPLIYPGIIRDILRTAIEEVGEVEAEEDDDRWPVLWMSFARNLHPEKQSVPEDADDDDRDEWIEDVVAAFCREHQLRDRFRDSQPTDAEWEAST